jgi:hypothetical protein
MKYLDCPRLSLISSSLDDAIFGDRRVRGQTEAYSCKLAGDDKQLLKELKDSREETVGGGEKLSPNMPSLCARGVRRFPRGLGCAYRA